MVEITNVCIGIQARTNSRRFPRKAFALLDGQPLLSHVIGSCKRAARFVNRHTGKTGVHVSIALLVPFGDEIKDKFRHLASVIEGPEEDVLARYQAMSDQVNAQYIVRVTGDCPLISETVIQKCINNAIKDACDYYSNVEETCRTWADGMDCEVISSKLLRYAFDHATEAPDREHVTTFLRREPPEWARCGTFFNDAFDQAHFKFSVDTPEDLERVREEFEKIKKKRQAAQEKFGKQLVHRF